MKILVLDNYDSFTFNLVHQVKKMTDVKVDVFEYDAISLDDVGRYDKILLSPGPGLPIDAGITIPLIKKYASIKSILGVCLGQQAIIEAFGGTLKNLPEVFHGVAMPLKVLCNKGLMHNIEDGALVGRYHSWVADPATFPGELEATALDADGNIMALQHRKFDVQAVQFHPESILTPCGDRIIHNWLSGI